MPDISKQYHVYIPGTTEGRMVDQESFDRNKDKLYSQYKDAEVTEVSEVDPTKGFQYTPDDTFEVYIPGTEKPQVIDAERFSKGYEKLYSTYPDAKVTKRHRVDYWGGQLSEISGRIDTLTKELETLPDDTAKQMASGMNFEDADLMADDLIAAASDSAKQRRAFARRKDVQKELEQLYRMRENNYAYQQYWAGQAAGTEEAINEIEKRRSKLASKISAGQKLGNMLGGGINTGFQPRVRQDEELLQKQATLTAAKHLLEDAHKTALAPSRYGGDDQGAWHDFWQGMKDGAIDSITVVSLGKVMDEAAALVPLLKRTQDIIGKNANIIEFVNTELDGLANFSDEEKILLHAFVKKAEIEGDRGDTISRSYRAGQSAIQSAGFMADFALAGGIGSAAAKAAVGGVVKAAGKSAVKKAAADTLYGLVKAGAMTPFMPSFYANATQNILQFNDAGGVDLSGKAILRAGIDGLIENVSETIGGKPLEFLAIPVEKMKFFSWAKSMRDNPWMQSLKSAGWNGLFEEYVEEWTGNALRVMTGVDKNALKDFAKVDQQLITLGAFAPMTLLGGAGSVPKMVAGFKILAEKSASLKKLLEDAGMDEQSVSAAMSTEGIESPEDLGKHVGDVYRKAVEAGADPANAYRAAMEFTEAASRYNVMRGMFEEQKDIDRSRELTKMDRAVGNSSWYHTGKNDASFVRVITDAEGGQRFVVGDAENTLALVDANGNKSILSYADLLKGLEDGTLSDSGEMHLNDYLDEQTTAERKASERQRMTEEARQNAQELYARAQIGTEVNIGTSDSANIGIIREISGGNFIVETPAGVFSLSEQEMMSKVGLPTRPVSDEEIEQAEAAAAARQDDLRKKANMAKGVDIASILGEEGTAILGHVFEPQQASDGTTIFQVTYNLNGQETMRMLNEDQLAAIVSFTEQKPVAEVKKEESIKETPSASAPVDFRGNPLPLRTNRRGEQVVDENALWEADPEAWAYWNDAKQNKAVSSEEKLQHNLNKLTEAIAAKTAEIRQATLDSLPGEQLDQMEEDLAALQERANTLTAILQNYATPAAPAEAQPAPAAEETSVVEETPEQEALLNEPNSQSYLPEQEYSTSKDSENIEESNTPADNTTQVAVEAARAEVNVNPTEAQKEAGNYKKGHITLDGYDITIENPKGSERRGVDESGKAWSQEMHNDYGYIRMTEGVDGDHIDVFLSDHPEQGNVFVVDQVNPTTGEFDEHKVMYGFATAEEARAAYLSNYEEGWQGLGTITEVTKDEFKKWVDSSTRKTKPFSEYKSVKAQGAQNESAAVDYDAPLNSMAEVRDFMREIGYKGSLSKVFESDGRKFVKFTAAGGGIAPNIYLGKTTKMDVLRQFNLYGNVMDVQIPSGLRTLFELEAKEAKEARDQLYASEREEIKAVLEEAGIPFVDVIDSERGSRIVFTDRKTEAGNYMDYIDYSDVEQVRDNIEFIRVKAEQFQEKAPAKAQPQQDIDAVLKDGGRTAVLKRIAKWQKLLGDIFVVHDDISSVEDPVVLKKIEEFDNAVLGGQKRDDAAVRGWYDPNTGKAHVYLPHLLQMTNRKANLDQTILHEVISHKGLRALMGDKYDTFLDMVWGRIMTAGDKRRELAYVGGKSASLRDRRAAADEFLAHAAEGNKTIIKEVDANFWTRLADLVKEVINTIAETTVGVELFKDINTDAFAALLQDAMRALRAGETGQQKAGEATRMSRIEANLDKDGIIIDDKAILEEYGLKNFTLSKRNDIVTLTHFIANEQGKGSGTRFMTDLAATADANGWTLALTPDDSFGATSVRRLKDFYKRFGFKENKGRNADLSISESMVRVPETTVDALPGEEVRFSVVTDEGKIAELENGEKRMGYRNVAQNEDGSFGSPMAGRLGKKGEKSASTASFRLGEWLQAEENPDLATDDGKIDLIKPRGRGRVDGVDYNPYEHIRPTLVNKQFTQAWKRPELVYTENEYPASELTSGYKAPKAKLPVGEHDWNGGKLILSRWDKPVRVVPWEEVADAWEEEFGDTGVTFDIVPPALLPILSERGVEILPPKKSAGREALAAYDEWKAGQKQDEGVAERLADEGFSVDETNGDVRFSVRYSPNEKDAKQVAKNISAETGRSLATAKRWVKSETSLAAIILDEMNAPYLDYEADDRFAAIKKDSDYPQGTVDFNNICRKRTEFTNLYQRIQKAYPNVIITGEDLATIRDMMKRRGITVACGLCYVEDRRQLLGEIAKGFIEELKGNFENYAKGSATKQKNAEKFRELLGDDKKDDLNIYDLITLEGSTQLSQEHPGIYAAFNAFNAARGQQAGNLFQGYAEYKREILKWSPAKVKSVNDNGGLRVFSYSDFEAHHLIDLVQIIQDCATKGVMVQGYTKVPAFAHAVAKTNIKLNRSLIPLGDTGIVDGKLAYDPVEGIDINDKDFLESNENVGNIVIGINDEQIRLAMADPFIHFIIPYHSNQSGVLRQMKQTGAWTNYKNEQTDKGPDVGNHGVNIYTDVLAAAEAEGKPIKTEKQFTEKFLSVCKERGWTPRFERFLNKNKKGDYVYTPGYYKLLVDFKLFDEKGRILPQKPVVAEFDDEFNAKILNDYVAGEKVKNDAEMDAAYDDIIKALDLEKREDDIRFSITTYHGTGADFDRFDHSHMGEGEGGQSYGWGTYVSTNRDTGLQYARTIGGAEEGRLYRVEIPDDNGQNYLHWDGYLTREQCNKLIAAVKERMKDEGSWYEEAEDELKSNLGYGTIGRYVEGTLDYFLGDMKNYATGEDPGAKRNSELLKSIGIIGLEIPVDRKGGQRYEGSNYVIFDESDLNIVDKTKLSERIDSANAKQKLPDTDNTSIEFDEPESDVRFSLSRNNRATVEKWLEKRKDLDEDERKAMVEYFGDLDGAKLQLSAAKWFSAGSVRLPEDLPKVEQAVSVAEKAKVDPLQYNSPMELLEAHADFKPAEKRINPEEVTTLQRAKDYPQHGIVVYDVDESQESREWMRKIINTHFGEDASPWCLLQGDGKGNLTEGSAYYWKHYNAYPKQVAFRDGKLLAFSANDNPAKVWWDRKDAPHYGIPITMKMPGDEQGRSATYRVMEGDGTISDPVEIHRGNKQNGEYVEWNTHNGQEYISRRTHYKNGVRDGIDESYDENGRLLRHEELREGRNVGEFKRFFSDGSLYMHYRYDDQGQKHGEQLIYNDDNGKLKHRSNYVHGLSEGFSESWNNNGTLMRREEYHDGKLNGVSEEFYENGKPKYKTHYKDNHPDGVEKRWYSNGQLESESTLKDGKMVGVARGWNTSGTPDYVYRYDENGDEHGVQEEYYSTGGLQARSEWVRGKKHGVAEEWWPNGQLKFQMLYKNDEKDGFCQAFHNNGQIRGRVTYKNGKENGVSEWYSYDGTLLHRLEMKDGRVVRDLGKEGPSPYDNLGNTEPPQFSITSKQDKEYMDAVEAGNEATADRLLWEAAQKAGYTIRAFHGGPHSFNVFDKKKLGITTNVDSAREGFFFTDWKGLADEFALESTRKAEDGAVIEDIRRQVDEMDDASINIIFRHILDADWAETLHPSYQDYLFDSLHTGDNSDEGYLKQYARQNYVNGGEFTKKQFIHRAIEDAYDADYWSDVYDFAEDMNELGLNVGHTFDVFLKMENPYIDKIERDYTGDMKVDIRMTDVLRKAKAEGYDSVIFEHIKENQRYGYSPQYVVFEPNQIKSAEFIVRDDDGKVIPLSERFNPKKDDIRFSFTSAEEFGGRDAFFKKETRDAAAQAIRQEILNRIPDAKWVDIVQSSTRSGNSVYVKAFDENFIPVLPKIRISDHSVTNSFRLRDEYHVWEDSSAKDVVDDLISGNWYQSSIKRKSDKKYMDAVEAGDTETAQKMVRDAARAAMRKTKAKDKDGYPLVVYHGTNSAKFTEFSKPGEDINGLIWITPDKRYAESYVRGVYSAGHPESLAEEDNGKGRLYPLFVDIKNPLEIGYIEDVVGSDAWNQIADKLNMTPSELYNRIEGKRYYLAPTYEKAVEQMNYIYDYTRQPGFVNLLKQNGYDGVIAEEDGVNKIPTYGVVSPSQVKSAEPIVRDDDGNVIPLSERFNPQENDIRFSVANRNQEIFVSNAQSAVEGIKEEKATPEQWLKQLEKNGGLKAGEDKWIGLSDWLKAQDKKTLTKQEILDYIAQNRIQIEEVHYADLDNGEALKALQEEFNTIPFETNEAKWEDADKRLAEFYAEMQEKYGEDYLDQLNATEQAVEGNLLDERESYEGEQDLYEAAFNAMVEKYGDDFSIAFGQNRGQLYVKDGKAAEYFLDVRPIENLRLKYSTEDLENKREIALTVPTIESWNEDDEIHFGDAGEGRAVAWIRYGDTAIAGKADASISSAYEGARKALNDYRSEIIEKYDSMSYYKMVNEEERAKLDALKAEEKRLFGELNDSINNGKKKVLFIDEIQSKRHQEAREKGYRKSLNEVSARVTELGARYGELLTEYGQLRNRQQEIMTEIGTHEANEIMGLVQENKELAGINERLRDISREMDANKAEVEQIRNNSADLPNPAPFEKNWHELAMKRMLRLAAEEGYDYVAWTTGEQQAERYNIGKVLNYIYRDNNYSDGARRFGLGMAAGSADITLKVDDDGNIIASKNADFGGKKLSEVVGKDMAVKMMSLEVDDELDGDRLLIGAEGMKGFYDEILPRFMNKYGKKWGVKVEDIPLRELDLGEVHAVPVTDEMKESVLAGQPMFSTTGREAEVSRLEDAAGKNTISERQRIASGIADILGVGVEFKPAEEMMVNGKRLAGRWQDGRISICPENCRSTDDAVRTVLHEAVGHEGLRKLVGAENMREFGLALYRQLPADARRVITDAAFSKYNGNIVEAVEEWLAERSEDMEFGQEPEKGIWEKVKDAVAALLRRIGIRVPLSDNDVRWILWQSYHANREEDLPLMARRFALANRLGFSASQQEDRARAESVTRNKAAEEQSAARIYNMAVQGAKARLHEIFVDMNDALNRAVEAIEKASGKAAQAFEDVRLALNQQSSKGLAATEKFIREKYTPMMEAIKAIVKKGDLSVEDIERYVKIKHGLERNDAFAKRDARNYYKTLADKEIKRIKESDVDADAKEALISREKDRLEKHLEKVKNGTDSKYLEFRKKDYGGLTAMYSEYDAIAPYEEGVESNEEYQARVLKARHPMYETLEETEEAAKREVRSFEESVGGELTDELWKRINAATKATLIQQYKSNMMSKRQYETVRDMFKFYVPLRGFKDNTAADMYNYYMSDNAGEFTPPLLKAGGRKTESESPFGYIGSMASSAITEGVKNETKLALYYFVTNRPENDLISVSEVWFENTGMTDDGRRIFTPVYPPLTEDLSAESARKAYMEWEKSMEAKAKNGFAYRSAKEIDLNDSVIHIDEREKSEHIIKFKVNGDEKMMFINGNPRAAQAINNMLNVNAAPSELVAGLQKVLRYVAMINTQLNPEFWMTNMQRDLLFATMSESVKGDKEFNRAFRRNLVAARKVVKMRKAYNDGTLGDSADEQLYREFVENGGVTGYSRVIGTEEWEREVRSFNKDERKAVQAVKDVFSAIGGFGEAIEQLTRFAAYKTSRESGKGVIDAVADAKELTVNFNRKGSGIAVTFKEAEKLRDASGKPLSKFEQFLVVAASSLGAYGRSAIVFFNAAVQGLNNMVKLYKEKPKTMAVWTAGYFVLGVVNAALHAMLDDDDDDYLDMPADERGNNLCLGWKGYYFKWALPQEARVFYRLGDVLVNHALGRTPDKTIAGEMLSAVGEVSPIDFASGVYALAPSVVIPIVEIIRNENWTGGRVYNDRKFLSKEEREHRPKYRDPLKNTPEVYVGISKALNTISGGNEYEGGALNWDPNIIEHLFEGYTGGAGTSVEKLMVFLGNSARGQFVVRDTPFLRRLLSVSDERYRNAHVTELYYYYKGEAENTRRVYKEAVKNGDEKRLEKLQRDGDIAVMQIYESYKKAMKTLDDDLKACPEENREEKKAIMRQQDGMRKEMIKQISELK